MKPGMAPDGSPSSDAGSLAHPVRAEARALESLVRVEAHRAGISIEPDPARLADGWQFRFVADGPRVEDALAQYRGLGMEVCADPIPPEAIAPACAGCRLVALLQFRAIYTRRMVASGG
jgi:hypothetical protein